MSFRDRIVELVRVPASEIRANPENWREHPESQRKALNTVVESVGFADAVLGRRLDDGTIELIDGHLRVEEYQDQDIPVLIVDLDENEARILLATHDPLTAMASESTDKLSGLFGNIETDNDDLLELISGLLPDESDLPKDADAIEVEEANAEEIKGDMGIIRGDVFMLGQNRLMCGDSTDRNDVLRLMDGKRADLVFTSPPYDLQRDYDTSSDIDLTDWDELMRGVFRSAQLSNECQILVNLGIIHREKEWVPYWDNWIEWMRTDQNWLRFGWYVWDQCHGTPGDWMGRFARSHEFIFHFNRVSVKPNKIVPKKPENVKTLSGTGMQKDVAGKVKDLSTPDAGLNTHKIPDSVVRQPRCGNEGSGWHPAPFSVKLAAFVIQAWDGLIYEPFCGSGTSIIAAEQIDRPCYGMEISPHYCANIINRWEKLTDQKAVKCE